MGEKSSRLLNNNLVLLSKLCYLMNSDFYTIGDISIPDKDVVQNWIRNTCRVDSTVILIGYTDTVSYDGEFTKFYNGYYILGDELCFLSGISGYDYEQVQEALIEVILKKLIELYK